MCYKHGKLSTLIVLSEFVEKHQFTATFYVFGCMLEWIIQVDSYFYFVTRLSSLELGHLGGHHYYLPFTHSFVFRNDNCFLQMASKM
jgi:hypothetical protein